MGWREDEMEMRICWRPTEGGMGGDGGRDGGRQGERLEQAQREDDKAETSFATFGTGSTV